MDTLPSGKASITVTEINKKGTSTAVSSYEGLGGNKIALNRVKTSQKKLTVPSTVSVNGKTYQITKLKKGFLKNNKKVKSISIGKNVKAIAAKAFINDPNLKTIKIKGKVKSIGKGAFKGISKNATIKVSGSNKQFNRVSKLITKSGIAKTVTIKR